MKHCIKKIFCLIGLSSLTLISCQSDENSIKISMNLDLMNLVSDKKSDYKPLEITTDELLMFINSKQDFALYFHKDGCPGCESLDPYISDYLSNKANAINLYSINASNSDFMDKIFHNETLHPYFQTTPQIMSFKDGQHFINMHHDRFQSRSLFNKGMNQLFLKSSINYSKDFNNIKKFNNDNDNYLLYLLGLDKNNSTFTSYNYYKQYLFSQINENNIKTLLVDLQNIENTAKKELLNYFNLDSSIETWCLLKSDKQSQTFDYSKLNKSIFD